MLKYYGLITYDVCFRLHDREWVDEFQKEQNRNERVKLSRQFDVGRVSHSGLTSSLAIEEQWAHEYLQDAPLVDTNYAKLNALENKGKKGDKSM